MRERNEMLRLCGWLPSSNQRRAVCVIAFLFWAVPAPAATELVGGHEAAAGEVLVKLRSASRAKMSAIQHTHDINDEKGVGGTGTRLLHSRSKSAAALVQDLSSDPDVLYAEPNYVIHPAALPNDPSFVQQYPWQNTGQTIAGVAGKAGADVSAVPAWDLSTGSSANVVAIIDSGFQYTHPDLAANAWSAPTAFTVDIGGVAITCPAGSHGFDAVTNTCDPSDEYGHGTRMAGLVGAVGNNGIGVTGINWTASIMGARFYVGNGGAGGTMALAVNAIEFAIQAKAFFAATGGANVRVLNASWSIPAFSQALLDEITRANDNDILLAAAADNFASDLDVNPRYPAAYDAPNIISVAATDNRDNMASFSDYGAATVHLGAPGVAVLSTQLPSTYSYATGTSPSTPQVAGAAALVLSVCPLNTAALKADILDTVDPLPSLTGLTVTGGRLNVYHALLVCLGLPTPTASPTPAVATQTSTATPTSTATVTSAVTPTRTPTMIPCPEYNLGEQLPVSTAGTTVGGSNSMRGASCGHGGTYGPDATYQWTARVAGTYVIDTFGSDFDTVLYVRNGGCTGSELACNDDSNGTHQSQVVVTLAAGQTVIVVVDGYLTAAGNYTLHISPASAPTPAATHTPTPTNTATATPSATPTPTPTTTTTTLPRNAAFVGQNVPGTMVAGQSYSVSVTMRNTGALTWTQANNYRLGSQNLQDNTTWRLKRVFLSELDSIAPGQQKGFSFTVTAPATAGTYNFQWRMVQEVVAWFGDFSPNVAVVVTAAP